MSDFVLREQCRVLCYIHRAKESIKDFFSDEKGVSPIIATVLILLFVVLLAVVFWDNISEWFSELWNKITENGDSSNFNTDDAK